MCCPFPKSEVRLLQGVEKLWLQSIHYGPGVDRQMQAAGQEAQNTLGDLAGNAFEGRCFGLVLCAALVFVSNFSDEARGARVDL